MEPREEETIIGDAQREKNKEGEELGQDLTLLEEKKKEEENDTKVHPFPLEQIGAYRILGELGQGGMGKVYKAYHTKLEREVAIKVTLQTRSVSKDVRERFLNEARLAAKLKHPNIVMIHDVGSIEGVDYMVMEFVEGETLDKMLKRGRISLKKALEIVRDVASAIAYAHDMGIVHRDLKPANFIMDKKSGYPMVMDFGLAKKMDDSLHLTESGQILGTPRYMSPEQASGEAVTHLSDIYSLGVILYEMVTGVCPIKGDTLVSIVYHIVNTRVPSLKTYVPDISPRLEEICLRAIEKSPAKRYRCARELAEAIDSFLLHLPAHKSPVPRKAIHKAWLLVPLLLFFLGVGGYWIEMWIAKRNEVSQVEARRHYLAGQSAFEKGNVEFALMQYQKAIELDPRFSEAYRMKGRIYHGKNDFVKAISNYDQAISCDKKNAWAYHDRGLAYYQSGDMESAVRDNAMAIQIDGKFMDAYNNRAIARYAQGDASGAIEDLTRAIEIMPNEPDLYFNRGSFFYQEGKMEEAERDYARILDFSPDHAKACYHRAMALSKLNRHKEAAAHFVRYLKLEPGNPQSSYLLEYIERHGKK